MCHTRSQNIKKETKQEKGRVKRIANSVNPEPIDDRIFQELKLSGKSGILLGCILNPKKCMGVKVKRKKSR